METRCPGCKGRNVGKVGTGQYYCWDCFIEFSVSGRGVRIYEVSLDGDLARVSGGSGAR